MLIYLAIYSKLMCKGPENSLEEMLDIGDKNSRLPNSYFFIAEDNMMVDSFFVFQGYECTIRGYRGVVNELYDSNRIGKIIKVWRNIESEKTSEVYNAIRETMNTDKAEAKKNIRILLEQIDAILSG